MPPSCWTSPALCFLTTLSSVLHFSQTQFDRRQQSTSKSTLFRGKRPNFNIFTGLQLGKLGPRFLFIYFLIPCNWKWTATSLRLPRTTLKTLMQSSPALNRSIKAWGPKILAYPPKQNVGWLGRKSNISLRSFKTKHTHKKKAPTSWQSEDGNSPSYSPVKWELKLAALLTPAFPAFPALELVVHMSPLAEADTRTKLPLAFGWELAKYADPVKEKKIYGKNCYRAGPGFV